MKKFLLILLIAFNAHFSFSQTICNTSGNLMMYTNYDGGTLIINVDANIPNLKIGIVSYEAVAVYITGTYSNNITGIEYAGYNNSPNTNCTPSIPTTTIIGVLAGVTPSISFAPPVTLSNPFGYSSIICGYACSNTTSMGGCNTRDQIEAYFLSRFPSSSIYAHKMQYGCWSGTQAISNGGNCCSLTVGLDKNKNSQAFSIFPNPFSQQTTIEFQKEQNNIQIRMTDLLGKELSTQLFSGKSFTINKGILKEGIYFLQVIDENKNLTTKKIIIQ